MYVAMGGYACKLFVGGESMKDFALAVLSGIRTCLHGSTSGKAGTVFVGDTA